jgi:hypothetical protein
VLVVADQGLEHPGLFEEVTRRGARAETEVMMIAPVIASSASHALADDIDQESRTAELRLERAIERLR